MLGRSVMVDGPVPEPSGRGEERQTSHPCLQFLGQKMRFGRFTFGSIEVDGKTLGGGNRSARLRPRGVLWRMVAIAMPAVGPTPS